MKQRFLILVFMTLAVFARAQNIVDVYISNFQQQALANRLCQIQYLSYPGVGGTGVAGGDIYTVYSDGSGLVAITNPVQGTYRFTITAPPQRTVFQFLVTNISGTINVTNLLVASADATFPVASVAWAASVTDSRYAFAGAVGGLNLANVTNVGGAIPQLVLVTNVSGPQAGTVTLSNVYSTNITSTNITVQTITVSNLYTTNLFVTNVFTSNITSIIDITSNLLATNIYVTNVYATTLVSSNLFVTNIYDVSNIYTQVLVSSNVLATNVYTTNLFAINENVFDVTALTAVVNNLYATNVEFYGPITNAQATANQFAYWNSQLVLTNTLNGGSLTNLQVSALTPSGVVLTNFNSFKATLNGSLLVSNLTGGTVAQFEETTGHGRLMEWDSAGGNIDYIDALGNLTIGSTATINAVGTGLTDVPANQLVSTFGVAPVSALPPATSSTLGIVGPDNSTITIDPVSHLLSASGGGHGAGTFNYQFGSGGGTGTNFLGPVTNLVDYNNFFVTGTAYANYATITNRLTFLPDDEQIGDNGGNLAFLNQGGSYYFGMNVFGDALGSIYASNIYAAGVMPINVISNVPLTNIPSANITNLYVWNGASFVQLTGTSVLPGIDNVIDSSVAAYQNFIIGGSNNYSRGFQTGISGGASNNLICANTPFSSGSAPAWSVIDGGQSNVMGTYSGGGVLDSAIIGGLRNAMIINGGTTGTLQAVIVGGVSNSITDADATFFDRGVILLGGFSNIINSANYGMSDSIMVGGHSNIMSDALHSVILGGSSNWISANMSSGASHTVVGGLRAGSTNSQTFVWGDGTTNFYSTGDDQFDVQASGGINLYGPLTNWGLTQFNGTAAFNNNLFARTMVANGGIIGTLVSGALGQTNIYTNAIGDLQMFDGAGGHSGVQKQWTNFTIDFSYPVYLVMITNDTANLQSPFGLCFSNALHLQPGVWNRCQLNFGCTNDISHSNPLYISWAGTPSLNGIYTGFPYPGGGYGVTNYATLQIEIWGTNWQTMSAIWTYNGGGQELIAFGPGLTTGTTAGAIYSSTGISLNGTPPSQQFVVACQENYSFLITRGGQNIFTSYPAALWDGDGEQVMEWDGGEYSGVLLQNTPYFGYGAGYTGDITNIRTVYSTNFIARNGTASVISATATNTSSANSQEITNNGTNVMIVTPSGGAVIGGNLTSGGTITGSGSSTNVYGGSTGNTNIVGPSTNYTSVASGVITNSSATATNVFDPILGNIIAIAASGKSSMGGTGWSNANANAYLSATAGNLNLAAASGDSVFSMVGGTTYFVVNSSQVQTKENFVANGNGINVSGFGNIISTNGLTCTSTNVWLSSAASSWSAQMATVASGVTNTYGTNIVYNYACTASTVTIWSAGGANGVNAAQNSYFTSASVSTGLGEIHLPPNWGVQITGGTGVSAAFHVGP